MKSRSVTFVIFEDHDQLDLTGPYEVFAEAGYRCTVVAPEAGPVRSDLGLSIVADRALAGTDPTSVDTLIVTGGRVRSVRQNRELIDWIAAAAGKARRVASVCTGTFLLAEAGLLDGRRATTHWAEASRLAADYPAVTVDADAIYVKDGRIWTSAGVTAGMDLALAMVEADLGRAAALDVARTLVLYLRRPGSQSQFSVPLWSSQPDSDVIRTVVDAVHAKPGDRHSIEDLAALAGLSPRHFQRRFTREVGMPPAGYLERVRIEAAQQALAETELTLDTIARRYGFGTGETLRRSFHRLIGIAPSDYRDRFGTTARRPPSTLVD
ncbi:GlxA family transcriptional regulator [Microlunatus speluncae]|uniref:GlxA family transcriptional regulator n=1 Tax=Microlunatus speluncae TaxID=2594267 RepID=UPI001266278A|nr:GlxA family transcriptional regulator [Microlunatus speluncae]